MHGSGWGNKGPLIPPPFIAQKGGENQALFECAADTPFSRSQAPAQESPEGIAGLADCDGCVLWPEPQPSDEGRRCHRAVLECRGQRVARLESGSRRHPCRPSIAQEILEFVEQHRVDRPLRNRYRPSLLTSPRGAS